MPIVERRENCRSPAAQSNRFALVIGCDKYRIAAPLSKAVNDAVDIHMMLKKAGFQSTLVVNATKNEMVLEKEALIDAVRRCDGPEPPVVTVFFSGHGEDVQKRTHLLAVDSRGGLEMDSLVCELNRVTRGMTLILLADACRADESNITFKTRSANGCVTAQDWSDATGLRNAEMPTFKSSLDQGRQGNKFFMGFACKPGTCALENKYERNGYFTKALLQHLVVPGRPLAMSFMEVVGDVQQWTDHRQGPWSEGDVAGKLVLFPGQQGGAGSLFGWALAAQPAVTSAPATQASQPSAGRSSNHPPPLPCPKGHMMVVMEPGQKPTYYSGRGVACNVCMRNGLRHFGTPYLHCSTCRYDLCFDDWTRKAQSAQSGQDAYSVQEKSKAARGGEECTIM